MTYLLVTEGFMAGIGRKVMVGRKLVLACVAVVMSTVVPVLQSHAAAAGTTCTTTLLDALVLPGGAETTVASNQTGTETDLCIGMWVASAGAQPLAAGVLTVTGAPVVPSTVDTQSSACLGQQGYRRLAGGTVAATPFFLDVATPPNGVELCVQIATVQGRVLLGTVGGGVPQVGFTPTILGANPISPRPSWPATNSSSACTSDAAQLAYSYISTPTEQIWTEVSNTYFSDRFDVCVRYQGPITFGGHLAVPQSAVDWQWNPAACPFPLLTLTDPVALQVTTSSPGGTPLSICFNWPSTGLPVFSGTSRQATVSTQLPPSVVPVWYRDSDSVV